MHLGSEEITKMQIKRIEKEIRDTPYHKATEHHVGKLKARLSKLRESLEFKPQKGGGGGYSIKKQGDATIVLVGPPSAGKSTLINELTNARSKVAPYAFTTVNVIPGMMRFRDTDFQILDVPGLIEGAETGKGRGREVLSVIRGADLLIIISDISRPEALERISRSLEDHGIRINKHTPRVRVVRKNSGGLAIYSNIHQPVNKQTIAEIAREMGIKNADIAITEELSLESLVDAFSKNRVYIPAIFVLNKIDTAKPPDNHPLEPLFLSAEKGTGINELKEAIWKTLLFIRVYLVHQDEEPGTKNPLTVKAGTTLREIAQNIGGEFAQGKEAAKIWGTGAKFPAQEVSLTTEALDGMQIRFV